MTSQLDYLIDCITDKRKAHLFRLFLNIVVKAGYNPFFLDCDYGYYRFYRALTRHVDVRFQCAFTLLRTNGYQPLVRSASGILTGATCPVATT